MTELLQTKLHIPKVQPGVILRPALTARLAEGLHRRLTLLAAAAGFGKTTLVATWPHSLPADLPIGWLTLDEHDNDPQRFLVYLTAALAPGVGQAHTGVATIEARLILLLNQWAAGERPVVLVLDDYHLIEQPAIDTAITFLIDHAPPTLHLLMTTRVDPALPLSRWRARQQLVAIRAQDLRFTRAEMATLLQKTWQLPITEADVARLDAQTEGWVAAGYKNQEIADELIISLNTVRYHTKNLYGKLGVNKRTQAVAQAQTLGLLSL
ncbi:MAG: LuxR C-terminal-related transcriptional regulator [Caldilineaceae bacterium]